MVTTLWKKGERVTGKGKRDSVVMQFGVGGTDCAITEPWPEIGC